MARRPALLLLASCAEEEERVARIAGDRYRVRRVRSVEEAIALLSAGGVAVAVVAIDAAGWSGIRVAARAGAAGARLLLIGPAGEPEDATASLLERVAGAWLRRPFADAELAGIL